VDDAGIIRSPYAAYWVAAIVASAVVAIVASTRGWRRGVYVFKPLTTLLILGFVLTGPANVYLHPLYRPLVAVGLAFSLAGDVLLMLPRDRFVAGLAAFLVAHLLYIAAFTTTGVHATWWIVLPLAAYGAVLLRILLPHVPARLKPAVAVYALALLAMAWTAAERDATSPPPSGAFSLLGGVLFVASDSALAIDRFVRQFRGADAVVLGTYYAAQLLIAFSVGVLGYYVH
jgi:uncharacterized membrane protein YhhN